MRVQQAVVVGVLILACASGCDRKVPSTAPVAAVHDATAMPATAQALIALDDDGLRARAVQALRDQRIHSPAGDCAVDYYLALRDRTRDDAATRANIDAALTELQPYVLIAAEQSLARTDLDEVQRLLAMLVRIDAQAPALPRLRDALRVAQQKADEAESAQLQLARMETASPAPVAPASRPPATAMPPVASPPIVHAPVAPPVVPAPVPEAAVASTNEAPAAPPRATAAPAAVAMPRLIADAAPRYPLAARNRRIEGRVQVAFTIEPDGSVHDARLVSAQPAGVFEEAALAAAARWRFEATGRRVDTTRTLTFQLPPG